MRTYETPMGPVNKKQWMLLKYVSKKTAGHEFGDCPPLHIPAAVIDEIIPGVDWESLVTTGFLRKSRGLLKLHKKLSGFLSVADDPILPGSRRPMVSSILEDDEFGEIPVDALVKTSRQAFIVNSFMADKIKNAQWDDSVSDGVRKAARKTAYHTTPLFHDAYCDWRGRVYYQSSDWGSIFNSKVVRSMLDAQHADEMNTDDFRYMCAVVEEEFEVTIHNFVEVMAITITNAYDAQRVRAAYAIFEYTKYRKTAYLMEQDATCSGGQIVALLTGDRDLGIATNVVPSSVKQDLYKEISDNDNMMQIWHLLGLDGMEHKGLRRELAKPVVMVSFYGGSADAVFVNVWDRYDGEFETNEDGKDVPTGSIMVRGHVFDCRIVKKLVDTMSKMVKGYDGFDKFLRYARSCGSVIEEQLEGRFSWTTATGFQATGFDLSAAGYMPNMVHSIDASIVQTVLVSADFPVFTVHDAFFTTPCKARRLRDLVKDAYVVVIEDTELPTLKRSFDKDTSLLDTIHGALVIGEHMPERSTITA